MISLDHRFLQGDSLQLIWPRCSRYSPLGTLLPRRIVLAEPDCEKASARGHLLERYGYEVLSCCHILSIKKCFQGMAQHAKCRNFVNLIMCDVRVLDEALTGFIQTGQTNPEFPPLLLLSDSNFTSSQNYSDLINYQGMVRGEINAHDQILLARQWAPY